MLVKTYGAAVFGINATIVTAEVNVYARHGNSHVGLPDNAVKESYHRMDARRSRTTAH
jgi:magnesium chelatase family protein